MHKLTILHETLLTKQPLYLFEMLKYCLYRENSRLANEHRLKNIPTKRARYQKEFLPSTIKDWDSLDTVTRCSKSKPIFKRKILNIIRPKKSPYYGLFGFSKIRYLTMLRMELSPLNDHKYKHNFQNTHQFCAVCGCTENTRHYLLSCKSYQLSRTTMFNTISPIIRSQLGKELSTVPQSLMISIMLYGSEDIDYHFYQNYKKTWQPITSVGGRFGYLSVISPCFILTHNWRLLVFLLEHF